MRVTRRWSHAWSISGTLMSFLGVSWYSAAIADHRFYIRQRRGRERSQSKARSEIEAFSSVTTFAEFSLISKHFGEDGCGYMIESDRLTSFSSVCLRG